MDGVEPAAVQQWHVEGMPGGRVYVCGAHGVRGSVEGGVESYL
jgi:hypothetical protein